MTNKFERIDAEVEDRDGILSFSNSMFKLGEFMGALKKAFRYEGLDQLGKLLSQRGGVPTLKEHKHLWFYEGLDCEILRVNGKSWEKGKVRIKVTLEFCPDESEMPQTDSPLDELRKIISQEN
ncbi:hypothetical protein H6F74_18580 [Trichocoleus sp. FACHB-90]|nr:hypothetical protein [Trichocoleus sp. FACHB-90]